MEAASVRCSIPGGHLNAAVEEEGNNCSKDEKDGRGEFEAGAEEEEEGSISICYDTRKERKGKKHGKELNYMNFRSVL